MTGKKVRGEDEESERVWTDELTGRSITNWISLILEVFLIESRRPR